MWTLYQIYTWIESTGTNCAWLCFSDKCGSIVLHIHARIRSSFGPFWTEFPVFWLESGEDHLRNKLFDVITVIKMLTNQTPTEKISEIYTITTEDRMVSKNIIMINQIELSQWRMCCSNNPRRWGKNSQIWAHNSW